MPYTITPQQYDRLSTAGRAAVDRRIEEENRALKGGDWEEITGQEELIPGRLHRITLYVRIPYTKLSFVTLRDAIRLGVGLRNLNPFQSMKEKIDLLDVFAKPPSSETRTGRYEPWQLVIDYKPRAGNTPVLVIYGLLALIVAGTGAVLISGKRFERLIDKAAEAGEKTIFNPGFILAAFVIGFLFLRGRARA